MKTIKGYKAYEKGLVCKGFQYEVGKTYEQKESPKICDRGFHFCENPLDVLNYYNLCECEFTEVEAEGKVDKEDDKDTKIATNKIKIGAKLDLPMFIKASIDFVSESCKKDKKTKDDSGYSAQLASSGNSAQLASSGNSAQLASSGDSAQLASSGNSAKLASSGNYAQLASSGYSAQLASSGYSAQLASSGNYAKLASSGNYSQLASSGNYSQLASSGYSAQLASSGDYAQLASSGDSAQLASSGYSAKLELNGLKSVGANIGINGIIKGKEGNWITLAEYKKVNGKYEVVFVESVQIDGKKLKEDTFYKLENKKFVEVK